MGSYELLLGAADRALYQAKEGGRDMVCAAQRYTERAGENVPRLSGAMSAIEGDGAAIPSVGARLYLVDDDAAVRSVIKRMLAREGYQVWDTGDPVEAIAHFSKALPHERPDVVLTDVIMPEMTGMRMIDAFAKISPAIKVIYMSGYVQSTISWGGTPGAVVTFLEKPFEREDLLGALQGVL
jgi:CheY-like chemotaxis protein